jgi:hypothetical protein
MARGNNGAKPKTVDQWAAYICEPWNKTVEAFVETGKRLIEAKKALKEELGHGNWGSMFTEPYPRSSLAKGPLPFSQRIGNMLMRIARHPVLSNSQFFSKLPPSYSTLYILSDLPEAELVKQIEEGKINPSLLGSEAKVLGFNNPDRAFKSLRLLCEIARYVTPAALAEHWDEDFALILGVDEIRQLDRLAAYITALQAELWKRYEQTAACMEGWKENNAVTLDEECPADV